MLVMVAVKNGYALIAAATGPTSSGARSSMTPPVRRQPACRDADQRLRQPFHVAGRSCPVDLTGHRGDVRISLAASQIQVWTGSCARTT